MSKKRKLNVFFLYFSVFLLLAACSNDIDGLLVGPDNPIEQKMHIDLSNKAEIVLYLEEDKSKKKQSILVLSGDRLLGALLKGLYFSSYSCVGEELFRFENRQKGFHLQDTITNTHFLNLVIEDTSTVYLGVSVNEDNSINVQKRDENIALGIIGSNEYRTFLVNRKVEQCVVPAPQPEKITPVKLKNIELSADALFGFNESILKNLAANNKIDHLLEEISASGLDISKIIISGHADRLGNKVYNQNLSLKRAETVMNYLRSKGIKERITSVGFGSTKPITNNQCSDNLPREVLIACLQPDRRVSVELWGNAEEKLE